jgi:hypothetical protein
MIPSPTVSKKVVGVFVRFSCAAETGKAENWARQEAWGGFDKPGGFLSQGVGQTMNMFKNSTIIMSLILKYNFEL